MGRLTPTIQGGSVAVIRRRAAILVSVAWIGGLSLAAAADPAPTGAAPIPATPAEVRPILIGAEAPGLVLQNSAGEEVDLGRALEMRSTILVFYRAHW